MSSSLQSVRVVGITPHHTAYQLNTRFMIENMENRIVIELIIAGQNVMIALYVILLKDG